MSNAKELDSKVITAGGIIKHISELKEGENVIDYVTGELLHVESVEEEPGLRFTMLTYNDHRTQIVPLNGLVYTGINIVPLLNILDKSKNNPQFLSIFKKFYQVYTKTELSTIQITKSPFFIGCIVVYGDDSKCPFVSFKMEKEEFENILIRSKMNEKYGCTDKDENGNVILQYKDGHTLTWSQYLSSDIMFYDMEKKEIPTYFYLARNDIKEDFISGMIEMTFNPKLVNDGITLSSDDNELLIQIRNYLYHIGIISIFEINNNPASNFNYNLIIVGLSENNWPKFFDNIPVLNKYIETYGRQSAGDFELRLSSIRAINLSNVKSSYNIKVKEGKNKIILTSNYLPRVTL